MVRWCRWREEDDLSARSRSRSRSLVEDEGFAILTLIEFDGDKEVWGVRERCTDVMVENAVGG